jgi:hypothetical protein
LGQETTPLGEVTKNLIDDRVLSHDLVVWIEDFRKMIADFDKKITRFEKRFAWLSRVTLPLPQQDQEAYKEWRVRPLVKWITQRLWGDDRIRARALRDHLLRIQCEYETRYRLNHGLVAPALEAAVQNYAREAARAAGAAAGRDAAAQALRALNGADHHCEDC